MEFTHERIDENPPCGRLGFCLTPDLTGNGRPDVVVGGMGATMPVEVLGKQLKLRLLPVVGSLIKHRESNIFWYENPGWKRHEVSKTPDLSIGASMGDITGDGRRSLVAGCNMQSELYWFEIPENPRNPWTRHLITDAFTKYHDTEIADVDGDGEPEVIILSQDSEVVCYYDIPDDPYQRPWPTENRTIVADGINVEGVAVADLNADGIPELIAGPNIFSRNGSPKHWNREQIGEDWVWTRIAVADFDGDGRPEVAMTEGDLPYHGDRLGRLGIFDPQEKRLDVIDDGLYNPHTLQVADFAGSGTPDLLVGEMGLGERSGESIEPRLLVYRNTGSEYERIEIARGVPTHEAKAVDLTGDGRLDIVGKSYEPETHVDAWVRTG